MALTAPLFRHVLAYVCFLCTACAFLSPLAVLRKGMPSPVCRRLPDRGVADFSNNVHASVVEHHWPSILDLLAAPKPVRGPPLRCRAATRGGPTAHTGFWDGPSKPPTPLSPVAGPNAATRPPTPPPHLITEWQPSGLEWQPSGPQKTGRQVRVPTRRSKPRHPTTLDPPLNARPPPHVAVSTAAPAARVTPADGAATPRTVPPALPAAAAAAATATGTAEAGVMPHHSLMPS